MLGVGSKISKLPQVGDFHQKIPFISVYTLRVDRKCICQNLSPTFLQVLKFDVQLGVRPKIFKITEVS